jgi:hypothetical protein
MQLGAAFAFALNDSHRSDSICFVAAQIRRIAAIRAAQGPEAKFRHIDGTNLALLRYRVLVTMFSFQSRSSG